MVILLNLTPISIRNLLTALQQKIITGRYLQRCVKIYGGIRQFKTIVNDIF